LWFCKRSWWRQGRTWLSITNWQRKKQQFKEWSKERKHNIFNGNMHAHISMQKREFK
jgi:hypothetical protein